MWYREGILSVGYIESPLYGSNFGPGMTFIDY